MSPYYKKVPLDVEFSSVAGLSALPLDALLQLHPQQQLQLHEEDPTTGDDWKVHHQRKSRHHPRSSGARVAKATHDHRAGNDPPQVLRPKVKRVSTPPSFSLQDMRHDKEMVWLEKQQHGRTIPNGNNAPQRHANLARARAIAYMSKSAPRAISWPPPSRDLREDPDGLLDDLIGNNTLATSAPDAPPPGMSRSHGTTREMRPMTLFESALIYNGSGALLSHDNFELASSSPDLTGCKRKPRRVSRRKYDKVKGESNHDERINQDEVVLELMCSLLPNVDVTKEMNLALLGGGRQQGDVFDFEEDEEASVPMMSSSSLANNPSVGCSQIDLLRFKSMLTTLLFELDHRGNDAVLNSSPSDDIAAQHITELWISRSVLRIVTFDVAAQYDGFAVILAIFRVMPAHRHSILEAVAASSLALYQHQGVNRTQTGIKYASMKGLLSFLSSAMDVIECDNEHDAAPDAGTHHASYSLCGLLFYSVKLLVRSTPCKPSMGDEQNQLEKFKFGSDAIEATTHAALGAILRRLINLYPGYGEEFLDWMVIKWPQRHTQLQVFFLRYMASVLVQFMKMGLSLPPPVVGKCFVQLRASVTSPHFLIANEACDICGNLRLMDLYLSRDQVLREQLASALHQNARYHWNKRIRQISDEYFDVLLDFA